MKIFSDITIPENIQILGIRSDLINRLNVKFKKQLI